jgi:hypothetical protein
VRDIVNVFCSPDKMPKLERLWIYVSAKDNDTLQKELVEKKLGSKLSGFEDEKKNKILGVFF